MEYEQIITVIPEGLEQMITITPEGVEQFITVIPELQVGARPILEALSVTPADSAQTFLPDEGVDGFSKVQIDPIPPNYGLITWDGTTLTVS